MNYLCIDYGLKHLGLAIATTKLAEPLKTVPAKDSIPTIIDLISRHQIDHIIIGLPQGKIAEAANEFSRKLSKHTVKPITLHDETLSSHEAKQKLRSAKKSKRSQDHQYAAALILQDYLDFNDKESATSAKIVQSAD